MEARQILTKIWEYVFSIFTILGVLLLIFKDMILSFFFDEENLSTKVDLSLISYIFIVQGLFFWYIKRIIANLRQELKDFLDSNKDRDVIQILRDYKAIQPRPEFNKERNPAALSAQREMLFLVKQFTRKWKVRIDQQIESEYYIYTLAASHHPPYLFCMEKYLSELVESIQKDIKTTDTSVEHLFFLIVPCTRNVILAEAVSKRLHIPA